MFDCSHLAYADDAVLLAPSPDTLEELLDQCELYAVDHCMVYNVNTPVYICIKSSVMLNGRTITFVTVQKYLCVLMNNDLNDNDDMNQQILSICCAGNILNKGIQLLF